MCANGFHPMENIRDFLFVGFFRISVLYLI